MKRKVIQIAGSTQLLSLPRKWALKHGVRKGDELDVLEEGNQLLIRTGAARNVDKKGELQFTDAQSYHKTPLATLYKLGYSEVIIMFKDARVIDLINKQLEELMGFEVVHQQQNSVVIKNVAEAMSAEFDAIFRRLFLTVLSSAQESLTIIKQKQYDALQSVFAIEKTINKLTFLCERLLTLSGYTDKDRSYFMYAITNCLEAIGDVVARICGVVDTYKPTISGAVLDFYKRMTILLESYHELYYKYNMNGLCTLQKQVEEERSEGLKLLMAKRGTEVAIVHFLVEIIDHIYEASTFLGGNKVID